MLSGPFYAPASGGPAKQLVVFLHGVGSNGDDLIDLAPHFAERLPDAAFVSPNAPFPCDMAPFGYQWFSLSNPSPTAKLEGLRFAAPLLNQFIDAQLAERGLTDKDLALVGFSQGTIMALHVAPRRAAPCAAVMGFSGRLIAGETLPAEIKSRPPIQLIHGEQDPVLPFPLMAEAKAGLEAAGLTVGTLACPGLGHSIDERGLTTAVDFVARQFGL